VELEDKSDILPPEPAQIADAAQVAAVDENDSGSGRVKGTD
jgi:hypothetical protein